MLKLMNINPELAKILNKISPELFNDIQKIESIDYLAFTYPGNHNSISYLDNLKADRGEDVWTSKYRTQMSILRFFNKYKIVLANYKLTDHVFSYYLFYYLNNFDYEELSGERLVEAYTYLNYSEDAHWDEEDEKYDSALHNSCMNDRRDCLTLYVENPEVIKVATVSLNNAIIARCLLWTIDNQTYYDNIYAIDDLEHWWLKLKMQELGYEKITDHKVSVRLSVTKQAQHVPFFTPYLDNMCFINGTDDLHKLCKSSSGSKVLLEFSNHRSDKYYVYCKSTNGHPYADDCYLKCSHEDCTNKGNITRNGIYCNEHIIR